MKLIDKLFLAVVLFLSVDCLVGWFMLHGVERHYGLDRHPDILLVGHSHLMLATDKPRMEKELGMRISKYTREGVNVSDKKVMVEHFFNKGLADSLKYVLYGVDLCTFTGENLSMNSYKLFYPFMDDKRVGSYIKEKSEPTDYWLHKLIKSSRFNDDGLKNSAFRGWLDNYDNFKNNVIDIDAYKKRLARGEERHIQMNPQLIDEFKETASVITGNGIRLILVNTPTLDLLNQFEPEKYQMVMEWFRDFAASDDLVEFWDFNPGHQSDYSIFSDRLHLNRHGQDVITGEIIKKIRESE